MPRPPFGVYETIVYAEDVASAVAFYRDVLGFALVDGLGDMGGGFRLQSGAVVLIFDPRKSSVPGRPVPSHGAEGAGHIAFAKDSTSDNGVQQLYVRDPAGNSVELVAGELWPAP